jgi:hypothetical protein
MSGESRRNYRDEIENKETDRNVREKNEDLVKRVRRKARNRKEGRM